MSTIKDYNFKGTQTMAGYRIGTNVIGHSERVYYVVDVEDISKRAL